VIFRRGNVETGIAVEGLTVRRREKGLLALLDVRRLGNCAYRGTIRTRIRNSDGEELATAEEQFTAEFSLRRGVRLPQLPPGSYKLDLELVSTKKGGANDVVLAVPPIQKNYDLTVSLTDIHVTPRE
jgi:hypothetical protein